MRRTSSTITVDLLQAHVATAGTLLEWIQAKAKRTKLLSTAWLLLGLALYLTRRIIREIQHHGPEHFDPEAAGAISHNLGRLIATIRRVSAQGDLTGVAHRFPFKTFYHVLQAQATALRTLQEQFKTIDVQWQALLSDAAENSIQAARERGPRYSEEPGFILTGADEVSESPSEAAIRTQFIRTASHSHSPFVD